MLTGLVRKLCSCMRLRAQQEASWGPLTALVAEGAGSAGRPWPKEKAGIKERWREVNAALAELREQQCAWTIPDAALRANLKDAIAEDFLPHYQVLIVHPSFAAS
jgi:hypothetical protein